MFEEDDERKETLPDLLEEQRELLNLLGEDDGEMIPILERALAENEALLKAKIDAYAYLIKRFKNEVEFRKRESQKEKLISRVCENKIARIESNLKAFMAEHNKSELMGLKDGFITYLAPQPSIELKEGIELDDVPNEFKRLKTILELDKLAVQKALKEGGQVVQDMLRKYFDFRISTIIKAKPNTEMKKLEKKK